MSNSFKSTSRLKTTRKRSSAKPRIELADKGAGTKSTFRIGIVSIRRGLTPKDRRSFWELRYKDPKTGRDVKRRVSGLSRNEIKAMAEHLTREAYAGRGYLADKPKAPDLEDGFGEALRLTNTIDQVRRERARLAVRFVKWLADRYPKIRRWDQLRPAMVQAYKLEMERRDLAYDTIRLALAPIKLAWRHIAENYPELVRPLPRMKIKSSPKKGIECLKAGEVAALLAWLRKTAPEVWPMANLQALCGLRMLEAAALRVQDVDLLSGTIEVTDTGKHIPKTRQSYRMIPICAEATAALRTAIESQRIVPPGGELFINRRGGLWKGNALTLRWHRLLRRAASELGDPRMACVPARKLRAAFATMAGHLGCNDRLVKAYLGQSPGDILGKHYRRIDLADLKAVSEGFENWRSLIDTAKPWKDPGNIRNSEIVST